MYKKYQDYIVCVVSISRLTTTENKSEIEIKSLWAKHLYAVKKLSFNQEAGGNIRLGWVILEKIKEFKNNCI